MTDNERLESLDSLISEIRERNPELPHAGLAVYAATVCNLSKAVTGGLLPESTAIAVMMAIQKYVDEIEQYHRYLY